MNTQPLWPADFGVHPNHCSDVLAGSYEIPFNPTTPPVILDLGANVGAFVRWSVKRWPGCTIHAYEPQPNNFKLLKRTVAALDEAERANVHLHELGVANAAGVFMLYEGMYNCGEWSLLDMKVGRAQIAVPVISAMSLQKADILKIDTEGCELLILETLRERLGEFSAVMMEVHNGAWVTPIKEMLATAGFALTGEKVPYPNRYELKFVKAALLP